MDGKAVQSLTEVSHKFILEADGLSKDFSGFLAVKNVSLRVRQGSIHTLIGPNGAGKTTLFNLLTRFLAPTTGRIVYKGQDITDTVPSDLPHRGICRSFQISAVFPHLTALENIRLALQSRGGISFDFWSSGRTLDRFVGRAKELLESVGLVQFANRPAGELPYGRRRALEIATTLALKPELMLLDEPTSGLGREDVARVTALIREVAAERTVLMVEHNLNVVAEISDTITVLQRGEVLAEGPYEVISRNAEVNAAYMGVRHA
jgi:branched-chain amino acid transport system ATP-binding protein